MYVLEFVAPVPWATGDDTPSLTNFIFGFDVFEDHGVGTVEDSFIVENARRAFPLDGLLILAFAVSDVSTRQKRSMVCVCFPSPSLGISGLRQMLDE